MKKRLFETVALTTAGIGPAIGTSRESERSGPRDSRVSLCIAPNADALQQHAAVQLQRYLEQLFGVRAELTTGQGKPSSYRFVIGKSSDPHVRQATSRILELSKQGHLVRKTQAKTMVLAGGSSSAVAWAVYELVERYGVRYLLHEDVLPANPGAFHLPEVDAVFEPVQQIRSWRQFNVLPHGPVLWSLEQQKAFIDQLFKLKFNGINLVLWPQHPVVDYQFQGIRRTSWGMLFREPIPIGPDNIGRDKLWPNMPVLTHPDFVGVETFDEALPVGRRLISGILDHAQSLGMQTCIGLMPLEFPNEFRGLLEKPTQPSELGILYCMETADLNNPKHVQMVEATFQAYLDQWGRVDEFEIHLPEHPQADRSFRAAWAQLARKFDLARQYDIDQLLTQTRESALTSGGVARGERELKSGISMLQFFEEFFSKNSLLDQLRGRKINLTLNPPFSSEQVFPFIHRVLPPGCGLRTAVDYTSSRAVRRMKLLEQLDTSKTRATLTITLQDDNIGWVPQVATENIHVLLHAAHRNGWAGFHTRYWPFGDLDPPVAYLSRASWNIRVSPRAAYEDHFTHTYGSTSTESLCQVMRMLEDATVILDLDFLSLLFPVPTTMWVRQANRPMAEGLFHILATYEAARTLLVSLADRPGPKTRQVNLNYWISRIDFGIHALHEIRLLHEGRMALEAAKAAKKYGNAGEISLHLRRAEDSYRKAVAEGERALQAAAGNVRDDSDRGALAAYYHFMVRVKAKAKEAIDTESIQS